MPTMLRKMNYWISFLLISFFAMSIVACDTTQNPSTKATPENSLLGVLPTFISPETSIAGANTTAINGSQAIQEPSSTKTVVSLPLAMRTFYSYAQHLSTDEQMKKQLFSDLPGLQRIRTEQVIQKDNTNTWGNETVFPEDSSFTSSSPEKTHLDQMIPGVFSVFNDGGNCVISYPISDEKGNLSSVIILDTVIPYSSDMEIRNDYEFNVLFHDGESVYYYDEATTETMTWPALLKLSVSPLLFQSTDKINPPSKEMLYRGLVAIQDKKMSSIVNADKLLRSLLGRMTHSTTYQIDAALIEDIQILNESKDGVLFRAVIALGYLDTDFSRFVWDTHALYASYVYQEGYCVLNIIGRNAIAYMPEKAPNSKIIGEMFADTVATPYMFSIQPLQDRLFQYRIDSVKKKDANANDLRYTITFSVLTSHMHNTTWLISDGTMNADGWIFGKKGEVELIRHGDYYEAVVNLQKG